MMDTVQIAKLCHEVNRAYCNSLGDDSQKPWKESPAWQRESAIKGVKYHRDTKDTTPADSHKEWMKVKKAEGWKYGKVKDEKKKTHPCMVAYSKLPKEQKAKDYIFKSICDFFKK